LSRKSFWEVFRAGAIFAWSKRRRANRPDVTRKGLTPMTDLPYIDVESIKAEYAPYHTHAAFDFGYDCYELGAYEHGFTGVAGQAFDRGLEAAMKVQRLARGIAETVGAD
jgi:hypothetical protein